MRRAPSIRAFGGGGKSGGGTSGVASEAPDSLASRQYAKLVEVISEGEIEGWADPEHPLRCVALDGTPIENADGTLNFSDFEYAFLTGTQDQEFLPGFDAAATPQAVGVKLTTSLPWVHRFTNNAMDAVRVDVRFPRLQQQNTSNGDLTGTAVRLQIWVKQAADQVGAVYVLVVNDNIVGKASNPYVRGYRINLGGIAAPWDIMVVRVTDDHDETQAIADDTYIESYSEIIYGKLRYPNSAVIGVAINAEQFGNIPSRAYRMKGLIVRVPLNYNPITREYATEGPGTTNGTWNGEFKSAWTNNPAWCYYDMATNKRYGLGNFLSDANMNKFALYAIAQYCDELVPDGIGAIDDPEAAPTVVKVGTAGTSTYRYKIVAIDKMGRHTAASPSGEVTNGNATLDDTNYNTISWDEVPEAVRYDIYRTEMVSNTAPTTVGKIGSTEAALTFDDVGLSGDDSVAPDASISGMEPRFACSLYLQKREDAMKVLTDMTTIFRGMHYFSEGVMNPIQDSPRDPDIQFGPANVINGVFNYSGTGRKARHTAALVSFNDQNNFSLLTAEPFEDGDSILKYGYNPLFITNLGCISQGCARRAGKWALTAERLLTDTVAFSTGAEGFRCRPGWIAKLTDPLREGADWSGRIIARNSTSLTLDYPVTLTSEDAPYRLYVTIYDLATESSKVISVLITNGPGTTNVLTYAVWPGAIQMPDIGTMWQIASEQVTPELFRILTVTPKDNQTVDIIALQYNPSLYSFIDDDVPLDPPGPNPLPNPNMCLPIKPKIYQDGISVAGNYLFESASDRFDQTWVGHRITAPGISAAIVEHVESLRNLTLSERAQVTDETVTYEFSAIGVRIVTLVDLVQNVTRDLHIGWLASEDRWLRGYKVAYRHENGNWVTLRETSGQDSIIESVIPGIYEIAICAVNRWGKVSTPVSISVAVDVDNPLEGANISGLEITGQGNDTVFTGKDVQFDWRVNSPTGADITPDDDGNQDPFFRSYIVTMYQVDLASGTDLLISAVSTNKVRSNTRSFTDFDVGRWLQVTAGTGFTPGWYQIVSRDGDTAVLDRAIGTLSSTGGTWRERWAQGDEDVIQQSVDNILHPTYTFTFQNNAACLGGPFGVFKIGVKIRDRFDNESDEAYITVRKRPPLRLLEPCNLVPIIDGIDGQWTNPTDISRKQINFYKNVSPTLGQDGRMANVAASDATHLSINGLRDAFASFWAEAEDVFGLKSTIANDTSSVLFLGTVTPGRDNNLVQVTFMPDGGLAPADNKVHLAHPEATAEIWYRINDAVTPITNNTSDGSLLYEDSVGIDISGTPDTVTARALLNGLWSEPLTRSFNKNTGGSVLVGPSFDPPSGTYYETSGEMDVTQDATGADAIFYTQTRDGSSPGTPTHDGASPPNPTGTTIKLTPGDPITISRGLTKIKALAQKVGMTDSAISSATYNVIQSGGGLTP